MRSTDRNDQTKQTTNNGGLAIGANSTIAILKHSNNEQVEQFDAGRTANWHAMCTENRYGEGRDDKLLM